VLLDLGMLAPVQDVFDGEGVETEVAPHLVNLVERKPGDVEPHPATGRSDLCKATRIDRDGLRRTGSNVE
jgi:hypothetical protein